MTQPMRSGMDISSLLVAALGALVLVGSDWSAFGVMILATITVTVVGRALLRLSAAE